MARSFNGTEWVAIGAGASLPSNSGVTVSFWNKVVTSTQSSAFTLGNADSPNRCQAHAPWSDNILYWDYGDHLGNGRISASYAAYLGVWTHVVLVSAGSGGAFKAIYFNGSVAASSGVSGGPTLALTGGYMGAFSTFTHTGSIGHFAAWAGVLSAGQIASLAAGVTPTALSPASLIVYYPLWGAASPEADLSGHAIAGVLTGTAYDGGPPVGPYTPFLINEHYTATAAIPVVADPMMVVRRVAPARR